MRLFFFIMRFFPERSTNRLAHFQGMLWPREIGDVWPLLDRKAMRSVVGWSTALRGVTSGSQKDAERFRVKGGGSPLRRHANGLLELMGVGIRGGALDRAQGERRWRRLAEDCLPGGLEEEPRASLRLVNPDLDQAGGCVIIGVADDHMRRA